MIINGGVQPGKSQIRALRETLGLPTGGNASENAAPGGLSPSQGVFQSPHATPEAAPAQPVHIQPATTQTGSPDTLPSVNNSSLTAPAAVQKPQTLPGAPEKPKSLTYEEMYRRLNPFKPLSEKELEAQRKRQRSNQVVTALGDGISAIANLVATSHGAHNAYDGSTTLTGSQLARYDQLRKDYDDNLRAYMSGLSNAQQLDLKKEQNDAYDSYRKWKAAYDAEQKQRNKDADNETKKEIAEANNRSKEAIAEGRNKSAETVARTRAANRSSSSKTPEEKAQAEYDKKVKSSKVVTDSEGNYVMIDKARWTGQLKGKIADAIVKDMAAKGIPLEEEEYDTDKKREALIDRYIDQCPSAMDIAKGASWTTEGKEKPASSDGSGKKPILYVPKSRQTGKSSGGKKVIEYKPKNK